MILNLFIGYKHEYIKGLYICVYIYDICAYTKAFRVNKKYLYQELPRGCTFAFSL